MTGLPKRLNAIAAAIPATPCRTCDHWPAIVIRRIDAHGAPSAGTLGGWPDTLTCPACGRQPRTVELERYTAHQMAS